MVECLYNNHDGKKYIYSEEIAVGSKYCRNCKLHVEIEQFEKDFAVYLDKKLYLPVKKEMKGKGTHSLGIRKERLKGWVEKRLKELKSEIQNV